MRIPKAGDIYITNGWKSEIISYESEVLTAKFTNLETNEIFMESQKLSSDILEDINEYWTLSNASIIKNRLGIK